MKFAHSFAALALCSLAAIASAAPTFPVTVNVTVRDFRGGAGGHTDFDNNGINGVQTGMVKTTLDADGKPVYNLGGGNTNASGQIASAASFASWYRDCDPTKPTTHCVQAYTVPITATVDAEHPGVDLPERCLLPAGRLGPSERA